MKQNIIFVFVLLAMLSIVNAVPAQLRKRATYFKPCEKAPIDVTEIIPDPLVSGERGEFYVSGKLKNTIPPGYILAALYVDASKDELEIIDYNAALICEPDGALECPYKAGTPFSVILSDTIPPLPKSYGIIVAIGDPKLKTIIGCAVGIVGGGPSSPHLTSSSLSSITTNLSLSSSIITS
jgi:hypothetical protein